MELYRGIVPRREDGDWTGIGRGLDRRNRPAPATLLAWHPAKYIVEFCTFLMLNWVGGSDFAARLTSVQRLLPGLVGA
jgi:hypothetical protein